MEKRGVKQNEREMAEVDKREMKYNNVSENSTSSSIYPMCAPLHCGNAKPSGGARLCVGQIYLALVYFLSLAPHSRNWGGERAHYM